VVEGGARLRRVEDNIEETLTFYRLPRQHHKHLKSTNLLERLNEEIKRRTRVVRIFPNAESCLRLIRALAVEMQRELAGGAALLEHGRSARAQEGGIAHDRLSRFTDCPVDNAARCPQGPTTTATMIRICRTL
jgi:transposase-like protein